jgi:acetyl-CoA C-acetyltransferase
MSNAPHLVGLRTPVAIGDTPLIDSLNYDGLQDPFSGELRCSATEAGNVKRKISREEQNILAARSH